MMVWKDYFQSVFAEGRGPVIFNTINNIPASAVNKSRKQ